MAVRTHIALPLCIMLATMLCIASCAKKRPYMCVCYSTAENRTYDIAVPMRQEADARCADMQSASTWDRCRIMLHE